MYLLFTIIHYYKITLKLYVHIDRKNSIITINPIILTYINTITYMSTGILKMKIKNQKRIIARLIL